VDKLMNTRFEPAGYTHNADIRFSSSVLDYIARWLGGKFISPAYLKLNPPVDEDANMLGTQASATGTAAAPAATATPGIATPADPTGLAATARTRFTTDDAPSCSECGMLMVPNGSCYKCINCGSTSGCS